MSDLSLDGTSGIYPPTPFLDDESHYYNGNNGSDQSPTSKIMGGGGDGADNMSILSAQSEVTGVTGLTKETGMSGTAGDAGDESLANESSTIDIHDEEVTEDSKNEAFMCPLHKKILHSLKDSKVLNPIHVGVKNLSYWYAQRKLLGPKRHNAMPIRQNPISMRWESNIYKMKIDNETGLLKPQKHLTANHNTRFQAFKRSEQECKLRDECPTDNEKLKKYVILENLEATHFRIQVVSAAFDRIESTERVALIYEALLEGMGENLISNFKGLGKCVPVKSKIASIFGDSTCLLPIFRFLLTNKPLFLIIEGFTPSQWKPKLYAPPDSERYGRTHLGFRSLEIPLPLLPNAHKARIKKLVVQVEDVRLPKIDDSKKPKYIHSQSLIPATLRKVDVNSLDQSSIENLSVIESLGMEPSVAGMEYKRLGGIYGHFLRDMPEEIKKKVMDKFKDGKLLIQKEGRMDPDDIEAEKAKKKKAKDSFQPTTMLSKMREKAEAKKVQAEYDKGTQSEHEMMEEIYMAGKKIERWAIRIQRIRRINITYRAAKRVWKRQYAAIIIQKLVRAHYGRQYAKLLGKLIPKAVARIKKAYFLFKAKYIVKKWQFLHARMSKRIIPKMKIFIANIAMNWLRLRHNMAIRIQSLVRMYLAKARYIYKLGARFFLGDYLHQAAIQIQRIHRGNLGRIRHASLWEAVLVEKVDKKAAIRIQRVVRGNYGRKLAELRSRQIKSANIIQRNASRFVRHVWEAQMRYLKRINHAATQIQKIVRARIDRLIYRSMYKKWYFQFKFIPALILLQSICRRHSQMKKYKILKVHWQACKKIQSKFRFYKRRCEALIRWEQAKRKMRDLVAVIIQKWVRRMICRIRFEEKKLSYEGKKVLAAKKIMRAWVSFKQYKRFQFLVDEHRLLLYKNKIRKLCAARMDLFKDLDEIKIDREYAEKVLVRLRARIKEVNKFMLEAENRLPFLAKEMSVMSVEDFERGWAEAFGQEYESLTNQKNQAREEVRLLKHQVMKREREVLFCHLELEEAHIELDNICVLEIEAYEGLRRAELKRIIRRVTEKWERLIRQEKMRWKSDATRYNVIMRKRPGWNKIIEKSMAPVGNIGRDLKYSQTIDFEKRAKVWDKEEILREHLIKQDGLLNGTSYKGYEQYITPIVETYDLVVNNAKQTLRGFALDDSANRIKNQYKQVQRLKEVKKGGQFAPLKDEFVMDQQLSFKEQMKKEMNKGAISYS